MEDPEIDEVALNVLLAEGVDIPTAVAGSIKDDPTGRPASRLPLILGLVAGLLAALTIAYILG